MSIGWNHLKARFKPRLRLHGGWWRVFWFDSLNRAVLPSSVVPLPLKVSERAWLAQERADLLNARRRVGYISPHDKVPAPLHPDPGGR